MLYHSSPLTAELGRTHRQHLLHSAERRRARRSFTPMVGHRALAPPRSR